jgi:hypothetical protein
MVIERAQPAAIHNFPRFINDIDPFRPAAIRVIGGIIHRVYRDGNRIMEARHEIIGDGDALRKCSWLHVANILIDVRLHLPFILRMRFANVHGQKLGAIFIVVVNLDEISNLAAEGRSSVAAENHDERTLADALVQIKRGASIERKYARIRCAVANMQIALMPLR